ncbi:hypothetical protein Ciccas_013587 [Cichlidogyrus casuarinus]|uniref:phosphatidylserine decarboxylase n=1 Tax=Cichlidogyrus casuarinus TaxID=1844966 RepID=A0ABD2PLF2_9PLAT
MPRLFRVLSATGALAGVYCSVLYLTDNDTVPKNYPETFFSTVLRRLPTNAASQLLGNLSNCQIPVPLRSPFFSSFCKMYSVDMTDSEEQNLDNFVSFSHFFNRKLKENSRTIDKNAPIVCPADGVIQACGVVSAASHLALQVKRSTFNLDEFIGPLGSRPSLDTKLPNEKSLAMHYCVIYLGPNHYHGFNSPTDWSADFRRHFPGILLSVNPKKTAKYPSLLSLNERVAYIGSWKEGIFVLTAVGAFGVGSIKFANDPQFDNHDYQIHDSQSLSFIESPVKVNKMFKGEKMGHFQMGSTIVLFFEAPRGKYVWKVKSGEEVKLGQTLINASF